MIIDEDDTPLVDQPWFGELIETIQVFIVALAWAVGITFLLIDLTR